MKGEDRFQRRIWLNLRIVTTESDRKIKCKKISGSLEGPDVHNNLPNGSNTIEGDRYMGMVSEPIIL